jgi:hypothetical protein
MDRNDLAKKVFNFLQTLEEFHASAYDDNSPIGAPWGSRVWLEQQGQQVWHRYWSGVLNQFLISRPPENEIEVEVLYLTQYLLQRLCNSKFGLTARVVAHTPSHLLQLHRGALESILEDYNEMVNRPATGYVIWPLQLGRGYPLTFEPVSLSDDIVFQGAILPNATSPQSIDVDNLMKLARGMSFPSGIRDYPSEAYLYVRLPEEPPNRESTLQRIRVNLFVMLCALRLSCGGDIAATQSCFLIDPIEFLTDEILVSGDIPAPLPGHRVAPWPPGDSQQFHTILDAAIEIYTTLTKIHGLREDLHKLPIAWSSRIDMIEITIMDSFAIDQSIETWLGFALQLLEYTYTRSALEEIIHCWAIMEALFVLPEETPSEPRYRSTMEKVAIRAMVLDAPKDEQAQQALYNAVRAMGDTRNMVAHGQETSQRKILVPTIGEFRDTVRRCLMNVTTWVAKGANDVSPACHQVLLNSLDARRSQVLIKTQNQYFKDYTSQV